MFERWTGRQKATGNISDNWEDTPDGRRVLERIDDKKIRPNSEVAMKTLKDLDRENIRKDKGVRIIGRRIKNFFSKSRR